MRKQITSNKKPGTGLYAKPAPEPKKPSQDKKKS